MTRWYLLGLLAPLCWALSNVVDRRLVGRLALPASMATALSGLSGLVIVIIFPVGFNIAPETNTETLLGVISGLMYGAATLFYFLAMRSKSAVLNAVALQLVPAFTLVLSHILIAERLGALQYAGLPLFLMAGGLMYTEYIGKADALSLLASVHITLACLFFSLATVIGKHLLQSMPYIEFMFYSEMGAFLFALLILAWNLITRFGRQRLWFGNAKIGVILTLVAVSELMNLMGLLSERGALIWGPASIVSAIACLQPLFVSALLYIWYLRGNKLLDTPWPGSKVRILLAVVLAINGSFMVQQ